MFTDDEGDLCSLGSQDDLTTALQFLPAPNAPLRLTLEILKKIKQANEIHHKVHGPRWHAIRGMPACQPEQEQAGWHDWAVGTYGPMPDRRLAAAWSITPDKAVQKFVAAMNGNAEAMATIDDALGKPAAASLQAWQQQQADAKPAEFEAPAWSQPAFSQQELVWEPGKGWRPLSCGWRRGQVVLAAEAAPAAAAPPAPSADDGWDEGEWGWAPALASASAHISKLADCGLCLDGLCNCGVPVTDTVRLAELYSMMTMKPGWSHHGHQGHHGHHHRHHHCHGWSKGKGEDQGNKGGKKSWGGKDGSRCHRPHWQAAPPSCGSKTADADSQSFEEMQMSAYLAQEEAKQDAVRREAKLSKKAGKMESKSSILAQKAGMKSLEPADEAAARHVPHTARHSSMAAIDSVVIIDTLSGLGGCPECCSSGAVSSPGCDALRRRLGAGQGWAAAGCRGRPGRPRFFRDGGRA